MIISCFNLLCYTHILQMSGIILLVDDDSNLNQLVEEFLNKNGFYVIVETKGEHAAELISRIQPQLVILDIILPGLDGLSICRSVRTTFSGPIMIVTSLSDDIDQVAGLETGADAYLTKPVKPKVLLAHIRALLRRSANRLKNTEVKFPPQSLLQTPASDNDTDLLEVGRLNISASQRTVRFDHKPLELTSGEFDLLWLLATHAGEIVNRDLLLQQVRGLEYDGLDRTIDQHISKIRKKLKDDAKSPEIIKSVRGVGYILTI